MIGPQNLLCRDLGCHRSRVCIGAPGNLPGWTVWIAGILGAGDGDVPTTSPAAAEFSGTA